MIKILLLSSLSLIILAYLSFIGFLYFNEQKLEKLPVQHESTVVRIKAPHDIQLIDDGLLSFKKRLELIRQAKESIEVEFFIYGLDQASRLITEELVKKAKQGVKVRLLVDFSLPVFQLQPLYANFLIQHGVEVKYYNVSPLVSLFSVQHRNHRKFLIVDDEFALTGGRNIANEYFNLSPDYNFLDSDILIRGPIVSNLKKSFDLYWNSELAALPTLEKEGTEKIDQLIQLLEKDRLLLGELDQLPDSSLSSQCQDISFVTDFPGLNEKDRQVFKTLSGLLTQAQNKIVAESPYFVIRHGGLKLLQHLSDKKIKLDVLTNGLYSTDAFYTVSALYLAHKDFSQHHFKLHAFKGEKPEHLSSKQFKSSERWGIHSKRAVIDDSIVVIGTYNIDPRSANLNSEVILICHEGKELAKSVSESIELRMRGSATVLNDRRFQTEVLLQDSTWMQKLSFALALPLTYFFDFLL